MTSLAADTSTWSPSKLAKVAAWEQAQFEAARKKANRRTLRSQFHKMTHRRTTSSSSSTCSASDAALQAPKLYIISGQSAEVFLIDVFLIAEVFLIDIGFKLRGQSTSVAADTWPIKYSSWSPPLLAKVSAWEQAQLKAARKRRNRRTITRALRLQFDERTHRRITSTSSSTYPASDATLQPSKLYISTSSASVRALRLLALPRPTISSNWSEALEIFSLPPQDTRGKGWMVDGSAAVDPHVPNIALVSASDRVLLLLSGPAPIFYLPIDTLCKGWDDAERLAFDHALDEKRALNSSSAAIQSFKCQTVRQV